MVTMTRSPGLTANDGVTSIQSNAAPVPACTPEASDSVYAWVMSMVAVLFQPLQVLLPVFGSQPFGRSVCVAVAPSVRQQIGPLRVPTYSLLMNVEHPL